MGIWSTSNLSLLPSLLPYANARELKSLCRSLARHSPAALAMVTSEGRWTPARHLLYLNQIILQAIEDAEARKLLLEHAKMIKDSAADYRQLLGKVREKLARERGFIL